MKELTQEELNKILDLHKKWLNKEEGGKKADLSWTNLSGADLYRVDLTEANLSGADLYRVDLTEANLSGAVLSRANLSLADLYRADLSDTNLSGVDLSRAYLSKANLSGANLSGANLSGANLSGANLSGANLSKANLNGADLSKANLGYAHLENTNLIDVKLPDFQIPQDVDLEVWKKIEKNTLVKLKIPKEAKRTACLINNKCRAEYAEVLEIIGEGRRSIHDKNFVYEVGKVVKPDSYNDDIREDCKPGIHFFMTKEEAEDYL